MLNSRCCVVTCIIIDGTSEVTRQGCLNEVSVEHVWLVNQKVLGDESAKRIKTFAEKFDCSVCESVTKLNHKYKKFPLEYALKTSKTKVLQFYVTLRRIYWLNYTDVWEELSTSICNVRQSIGLDTLVRT